MGKLGQLLVARGWITVQQLTRALQNQNSVGGRLGTCLIEMDVLGEELLGRSLAEQLGVPAAVIEDLRGIPDEVLHLIPEKLARRCRAIPFRLAGGRLDVAMQDPRNLVCQDEIAFASGRRVKVHVLHELRICEAMQRYYREECPARFGLLLDRLNRSRYLWGGRSDAAQGAGPEGQALGDRTDTTEQRVEVLSALPPDGLMAGPPLFAPPPLPEPALPSQPRRRSLFRSRGAEPPSPPPDDRAAGAAGQQPEQAGTLLPPLEELDFRAQPKRPAAPSSAAEAHQPPPAPASPASPLVLGGPGAHPPPAVPEAEPPAAAEAPPPAVADAPAPPASPLVLRGPGAHPPPAVPEAQAPPPAAPEPARPPTDLEATMPLGPRQAEAQPPRQVALTEAERADLGIETPAAAAPPEPDRQPPATLAAVEEAFAGTADREEVGRILLGFLAQSFRRVALFQTNRGQITAWMAHGDGIDQEAFGRYTASFKEPAVFLNLRQGSGIHIGPLPPMAAHRELALSWGGGLPRDCVVLPIRLRDRLVAVIYVDGGSRGLAAVDLDQMQRLTVATTAAFERCILSKKFGYPQS
jgi:MshEN domain